MTFSKFLLKLPISLRLKVLLKHKVYRFSTSNEALRMALSTCYDPDQFSDVISTLVEQVDHHIGEVRTQLVLALLLHEGI